MAEIDSITCPICGMTSHHPEDVRQGYCGNCHIFWGELIDLAERGRFGLPEA